MPTSIPTKPKPTGRWRGQAALVFFMTVYALFAIVVATEASASSGDAGEVVASP